MKEIKEGYGSILKKRTSIYIKKELVEFELKKKTKHKFSNEKYSH